MPDFVIDAKAIQAALPPGENHGLQEQAAANDLDHFWLAFDERVPEGPSAG